MSRQEMVKTIRAELKAIGINSRQVSVTSKDSLYDEVINATIKDLKVPFNTVKEIVEKHESIRYDEYNGEILAGCNVYTRIQFDYDAVSKERENYMQLAAEIIEKYKDASEGQLEVLARKGDIEILYQPNPHYNNKTIEVCKIVKQEYSSNYGEFYHSINNIERYNAHNDYAIAEAMVYIANQYNIDFFAPIPELNENDLEVNYIPEEEKINKVEQEKAIQEQNRIAEQVKNIKPLSVEDVKEKNNRINVMFPSLNKNNTLEEYQEELKRDYTTNATLITDIITLSNADYELFTNNFLCDCDFIAGKGGNGSDYETDKENFIELTEEERNEYINKSYTLGVLVQSESGEQIIVDPQGYSYARYVGFIETEFTTPEPPKPTKKNNTDKADNKINNNNVVDLASYKTSKVTAEIKETWKEEQATTKQLYALYCATKIKTTGLNITKGKASELISKSKAGQDIKEELKALVEAQNKQSKAN